MVLKKGMVIKMTGKNASIFLLESKRIILHPIPAHEPADDGESQWYAIIEKHHHMPIGSIGMVHRHPEWRNTGIQIVISNEENRREGYALEALELLERNIFDTLAYQRIAVRIVDFDTAAIRLFKRAGYKPEGVQEQGCRHNDRYYDFILLRLLRAEYLKTGRLK